MNELYKWYEHVTYQEAKNILREKMDVMKKNFIAAGYYMKYIRDNELFREDGYESIWEFAEDNYGIRKSTASRWMAMNDKFSQGGNSPNLADEFKGFEKSQLQEMLYLDDKQIEEVTPDMTVKEIREVRKPEKKTPIERECIMGKSPYGNCVCCGKNDVECCAQCSADDCNGRCGWIDAAVATSQQDDSDPDVLVDMNPPEDVDDHADLHEDPAEEVEKVEAEVVEEDDLPAGGKFEELSDKTDMDLLRELLEQEKYRLGLMREEYSENDIRVRKQKLTVGAYAGMIADLVADLDMYAEQDHKQPELPTFRNNDQRKEWLRDYKAWGLWYEDKNIGARYYKYDFQNGARLIAEEYAVQETEWCREHTSSYLHLVGGPKPPKKDCIPKWTRHEIYARYQNNETELVEFLKYVQKEAKENADRKVDK